MNDIVKIDIPNVPALQVSGEFVVMKPLCEAIGLDYEGQRQRIRRLVDEESATTRVIEAVGLDGRNRKMLGIHKDDFRLWLYSINTSRLKNKEAAETIRTYKREVEQVLKDYFETGVALAPSKSPDEVALIMNKLNVAKSLSHFDKKHSRGIARRTYFDLWASGHAMGDSLVEAFMVDMFSHEALRKTHDDQWVNIAELNKRFYEYCEAKGLVRPKRGTLNRFLRDLGITTKSVGAEIVRGVDLDVLRFSRFMSGLDKKESK